MKGDVGFSVEIGEFDMRYIVFDCEFYVGTGDEYVVAEGDV